MKQTTKRILSALLCVIMLLTIVPLSGFSIEADALTAIPSESVEFNGHYYKLYVNVCRTWKESKEYCESLGGHLATITSAEENEFLYSYITSLGYYNAYFGFTDEIKEGTWSWVTGEKVVYTNWENGEPNNECSNEDYGMFYSKFRNGKWNDGNYGHGTSNDSFNFICEWDSSVLEETTKLTAISNTCKGPQLKWNSVEGAQGYWVYRKTSGSSFSKIKTTSSTSYIDTTAKNGTTYTYTVKAYKGSDYSKHQSGLTIRYITAPQISSVQNSVNGPYMKWNEISGANGYYVYRRLANGSWSMVGQTTSTNFRDGTASSGTTYYYSVKAYYGSTTSSWYGGKPIKCLAAPQLSSVTRSGSNNVIKWGSVTGADGYYVYRKTSANGSWTKIATVYTTSYTDKYGSSSCYYNAKAFSGSTTSSWRSGVKVKTSSLATPQISSVQNSVNGPYIKWNTISGASGYNVYRKTSGGSWSRIGQTTATNFRDTTASSGVTYYYTIRAYAGSTLSSYNTSGTAIKCLEAPQISSIQNSVNGPYMKWNKVTGANGYYVFRRTGSGSWSRIGHTTSTNYRDTTASSGVTYYYSVKAYSGSTTSSWRAGSPIKCLEAPQITSVTSVSNGLKINWNSVTGATEYQVWRRTANSNWLLWDVVTGTSYTDTEVKSGSTFYYSIKASDGRTISSWRGGVAGTRN